MDARFERESRARITWPKLGRDRVRAATLLSGRIGKLTMNVGRPKTAAPLARLIGQRFGLLVCYNYDLGANSNKLKNAALSSSGTAQ